MSDRVACGNCGATNPAVAVTCGSCGAILAAYTPPAGASASKEVEVSRSPQPPNPQPRSPDSSPPVPSPPVVMPEAPPAPTYPISSRSGSSTTSADRTIVSPAEVTAPQTGPIEEFPAPPAHRTRANPPGGVQGSDERGERRTGAAVWKATSPTRPAAGSPGTDAHVSPESPPAPDSALVGLGGEGSRKHDGALDDPSVPESPGTIPSPPSRPAPPRFHQEHRLPAKELAKTPPSVRPPSVPEPIRALSRDTLRDRRPEPGPGRDLLASVQGQLLVLIGLGLVLASCLLGALSAPGTAPAAVVLGVFCTGPAGMLLIVVGVVILVARRSRRPI